MAIGRGRTVVRMLDPDRLCKNVGRRIAELRKAQGLTQEEFSVELGTSFQWVSQLEGGRNVTLHSLARIANALGVGLEELVSPPKNSSARHIGRPRKGRRPSPHGDHGRNGDRQRRA